MSMKQKTTNVFCLFSPSNLPPRMGSSFGGNISFLNTSPENLITCQEYLVLWGFDFNYFTHSITPAREHL